ncbi:hypothetical protein BD410DRAFT_727668 [Rickenella mellea]|uniref:Uncharacterized protein n=1 Tax=Rickenella mellea TaxID=50990 RepID=A0A4Y7PUF9_9AGAM|nr:hypothetical protein BD410DRAFT_727668 [Rickenella mellea]
MRGVSLPTHQYASAAQAWIESKQQPDGDKSASITKSLLASSCRAYTRVVLRLRAQAEAEAAVKAAERPHNTGPPPSASSANINTRPPTSYSPSSRPVSPSSSIGHGYQNSYLGHGSSAASHSRRSYTDLHAQLPTSTRQPYQFRSPLFRLGHAPLLRVFVPSVEGMWLSDNSVLDCEKELKRAGVLSQMRVGDVVWDTAVGDEGNIGRMVWDGNYLIDLDYSYSRTGDLPQYIHTLAFPPSYFHRVIRTSSNPICYIDISPWSEEIAANLQLLQDRLRTETPQGAHHTVVRWIHRSSFRIRSNPHRNSPITIPNSQNLTVDPAWYGTIVVETEGTNEGLADLQSRCKPAFPIRAGTDPKKVGSRVFRLLRERSRPGEIWICIVHDKERLM